MQSVKSVVHFFVVLTYMFFFFPFLINSSKYYFEISLHTSLNHTYFIAKGQFFETLKKLNYISLKLLFCCLELFFTPNVYCTVKTMRTAGLSSQPKL